MLLRRAVITLVIQVVSIMTENRFLGGFLSSLLYQQIALTLFPSDALYIACQANCDTAIGKA